MCDIYDDWCRLIHATFLFSTLRMEFFIVLILTCFKRVFVNGTCYNVRFDPQINAYCLLNFIGTELIVLSVVTL